jgi:hypothetical protein
MKMQKRSAMTILFVFFILLSLVSLLFLYSAHTTPIEETLVTASYTYGYEGIYDYTVALKSNTIYDNKTTLKPGEGTIYRRITDHINLDFTYSFDGDQTAHFTIRYITREYVQTSSWEKQIVEFPEEIIESSGSTMNFSVDNLPIIFPSSIAAIVTKINADTGMATSDYSLNITVEMHIEAKTSAGTVEEDFAPTLKIEFKSTLDQGEIISITGLENTKTGDITKTEKKYQPWVEQQREIYYGFSTVSFFGLAVSVWFYTKNRPAKPPTTEKLIEGIIEPYEEIIVEAGQEQLAKPVTTITMKTLEDLVKVADTTGKPIIHTYEAPETHVFSIIDGDTQYKFATTISIEQKRKEIIEEKEDE